MLDELGIVLDVNKQAAAAEDQDASRVIIYAGASWCAACGAINAMLSTSSTADRWVYVSGDIDDEGLEEFKVSLQDIHRIR
jgi:recombinational DNA repair protein (RecF pathway)